VTSNTSGDTPEHAPDEDSLTQVSKMMESRTSWNSEGNSDGSHRSGPTDLPHQLFINTQAELTDSTPTGKAFGGIAGRYWIGGKGESEVYAGSILFGVPIAFSEKTQARETGRTMAAEAIRQQIAQKIGLELPLYLDDPRIEWAEVWHPGALDCPMIEYLQRFMAAPAYTSEARKVARGLREYLLSKQGPEVQASTLSRRQSMTSKDERYREKITEAIEAANKVVDAAIDRVTEETLATDPDLGQKMTKINGLVRNGECSLFEAVKTVFGSDSEEFKQMLTTAADLEKLMGLEPGALVEDAKKPYKQDE
jgi:hypothetical protein